jgi:hypothetical protein
MAAQAGAGGATTTQAGAPAESGAGASSPAGGATDPECDLTGLWAAKQMTVSESLSLPQTSNNWYFLELRQTGDTAEVVRHFDCGIEVRGSVTVTVSKATLMASLTRNLQMGRKIAVKRAADKCTLDAEQFWSIRGADEQRFAPDMRNSSQSIGDLKTMKPLPTPSMMDGSVDTEGDGKPGIAFQVAGIIMGTRNSVQRDWSRWFTEPGYEIAAGMNWTSDLRIRSDFDNEESILDPTSGLLNSNSLPKAGAKHALKLRFLGRDASDARAAAMIKPADLDTCYAIQDALPAEQLE